MKFTLKGKKYKWNFEKSVFMPMAIVMMIVCVYVLGAAMCSM